MTVRGCAYAGSKGVVFGPIKDMAHISHGPVGCGQYSRAGRRNYYTGVSGVDSFGTLNFTSDFQERDIVFGGDKKLSKLIEEMELLFPLTKGITIQSECPVGLIGDDISAVANASSKALDKPGDPGTLRRLSRRVAVAGAPYRQTTWCATGSSTIAKDSRLKPLLTMCDHRRLQHRRRRLGLAHPA
ncbi:nitrogenase (molybdenum-iron) subunit alpha [Klebsiella michiganensis]|uniref:nitrogenase n=1 Tax=Klebsiella michiganensis TaxID=1134687 RepID=A0A7H4PJC5_9ENTR|nr:nitrogenase (molybdenum-iron) subunit alpha [Klebsiella michiganensis]